MKSNPNFRLYQQKNMVNQPSPHERFNYLGQAEDSSQNFINNINVNSSIRRFTIGQAEKQNSIRDTNLTRLSPTIYEHEHKFTKSTLSTNQQSHPKTSTQNLHNLRLQSQVLELQKTLDQQHFQIQTLTQQASHFMKLCQQQKQVLISLNIEGLKMQYEQQIEQLMRERQKVQQIICQLQDDYNEVYIKEENELNIMRCRNDEISRIIQDQLQRKKALLSLVSAKDKQLFALQVDLRENQQRIDELRNIQRKLTIAIKQLQMFRGQKGLNSQHEHKKGNYKEKLTGYQIKITQPKQLTQSPDLKANRGKNLSPKDESKANKKYLYFNQ